MINFEKLKQRIDNGEKVWIVQTGCYKRIVKIEDFTKAACNARSDVSINLGFSIKYPCEITFYEQYVMIFKNYRLVPNNKLPKKVINAVSKRINSDLQKAKEAQVNWDLVLADELLTDIRGEREKEKSL